MKSDFFELTPPGHAPGPAGLLAQCAPLPGVNPSPAYEEALGHAEVLMRMSNRRQMGAHVHAWAQACQRILGGGG
jgi:hypothetical protein